MRGAGGRRKGARGRLVHGGLLAGPLRACHAARTGRKGTAMILCCGEALVDMLPVAGGQYAARPGGSVFNTARALGVMGVPAAFLGGLSRDPPGQMLAGALHDAGVDTTMAPLTDAPTPLAMVELTGGEARYRFHLTGTALQALDPARRPPVPGAARALFTGGLGLALPPGATAALALARQCAGQRLVMLDPNIRPALADNPAKLRARLAEAIALADVVKLSLADLDWLEPGAEAPELRAARLLERGPALVLLTLGAGGAVALRRGAALRAPAPAVRVVDTIGAGDIFNAAVLAGLHARDALNRAALDALSDEALAAILQVAVTTASRSVTRAGAEP